MGRQVPMEIPYHSFPMRWLFGCSCEADFSRTLLDGQFWQKVSSCMYDQHSVQLASGSVCT